MKTYIDLPYTATFNAVSHRQPAGRDAYQTAAKELQRMGLSVRDIAAHLRIGNYAAHQLLEPNHAP